MMEAYRSSVKDQQKKISSQALKKKKREQRRYRRKTRTTTSLKTKIPRGLLPITQSKQKIQLIIWIEYIRCIEICMLHSREVDH